MCRVTRYMWAWNKKIKIVPEKNENCCLRIFWVPSSANRALSPYLGWLHTLLKFTSFNRRRQLEENPANISTFPGQSPAIYGVRGKDGRLAASSSLKTASIFPTLPERRTDDDDAISSSGARAWPWMDVGIQRRGAGPGEEKSILRARGKKSYDDDDGAEEKFISTPFMRNSEILRRDRARSAFPGESKWVFSFPGGVPGRNWSIGLYGGNNYSGLNGQFPTHSSISLALEVWRWIFRLFRPPPPTSTPLWSGRQKDEREAPYGAIYDGCVLVLCVIIIACGWHHAHTHRNAPYLSCHAARDYALPHRPRTCMFLCVGLLRHHTNTHTLQRFREKKNHNESRNRRRRQGKESREQSRNFASPKAEGMEFYWLHFMRMRLNKIPLTSFRSFQAGGPGKGKERYYDDVVTTEWQCWGWCL